MVLFIEVTNYWKAITMKAVQTYKVAPDDMQEAYQELLTLL